MIANVLRKKEAKPFTPWDFMPADFEPVDSIEETWENLRNLARSDDGEH